MIHSSAKWVRGGACEAPVIFGKIHCPDGMVSAKISICGLGFFELYVGGRKVGNDLLVPAWSDYEPRENRRLLYPLDETRSHRTYYMDYDLSGYLTPGENEIAVWLGNGWYNQHERNVEGDLWYELPKLAYTVEMTDGKGETSCVHSDESLLWQESPITFNNVYFGEKWDFTRKTGGLRPVEPARAPRQSRLMKQTCPPDREIRTIIPSVVKSEENRTVYDAGENISGYCALTGTGEIVIRYAENLTETGELDYDSAGGQEQIQTDEYKTDVPRALKPKFSIKAFRYFEVTGDARDVRVIVVHSDVKVTSSFESSDEILNWLYNAYIRTQLNNMHHGIASDCPHRERLGYTGDGQNTCGVGMLLLDSRELYRKWIGDVMDCQDVNTGHVQHTAPFYGGGGGPCSWGCAVVAMPYEFYRHYGDAELLAECWPHMLKWIGYIDTRMENDLVVREEEGGWCLGDWCVPDSFCIPEKVRIPVPLVNTYYLIKSLRQMLEIADVIGCSDAKPALQERIDRCMKALRDTYYHKLGGESQGADVFLADLGICEEADCEAIRSRYDGRGCFDTGIFGTALVTRWMFEHDYADTALALLTSKSDAVSFHKMMASGATTIWEDWSGCMSHDHPMFGGVAESLFSGLLGIRCTGPGWTSAEILPRIPDSLDRVRGHITVPAGEIRVDFDRSRSPRYIVTVPDMEIAFRGVPLQPGENLFD